MDTDVDAALDRAARHARRYLDAVAERRVPASVTIDDVTAALGTALPATGEPAAGLVDRLAAAVEPGLMANASGRFFGWVMGAALPAAIAADWLVTAWDQNAGMRDSTPGVVAAEEIAARWLLELLGLPADAGVGFTTGATMANFACLAAARDAVLTRAGRDPSAGIAGGPRVRVLAGAERHGSVDLALRYLGLGQRLNRALEAILTDGEAGSCICEGEVALEKLRLALENLRAHAHPLRSLSRI